MTKKISKKVKLVIDVLTKISHRDYEILIERFSKGRSMYDVAKNFNMSAERIRQEEDKIIKLIEETL